MDGVLVGAGSLGLCLNDYFNQFSVGLLGHRTFNFENFGNGLLDSYGCLSYVMC